MCDLSFSEGDLDDLGTDVDLRLFRLEHLMTRRPFMLNSVMLRQNPHNCNEWAARVKYVRACALEISFNRGT